MASGQWNGQGRGAPGAGAGQRAGREAAVALAACLDGREIRRWSRQLLREAAPALAKAAAIKSRSAALLRERSER